MVEWTDAMKDQLRTMIAEGCTASDIVQAMPEGLSRNAVIGKARRMKLEFTHNIATRRRENDTNRRQMKRTDVNLNRFKTVAPRTRIYSGGQSTPKPVPLIAPEKGESLVGQPHRPARIRFVVHPQYDTATQTWFVIDPACEARTFRELLKKLPAGTMIRDYYPHGFPQTSVDRGYNVIELEKATRPPVDPAKLAQYDKGSGRSFSPPIPTVSDLT